MPLINFFLIQTVLHDNYPFQKQSTQKFYYLKKKKKNYCSKHLETSLKNCLKLLWYQLFWMLMRNSLDCFAKKTYHEQAKYKQCMCLRMTYTGGVSISSTAIKMLLHMRYEIMITYSNWSVLAFISWVRWKRKKIYKLSKDSLKLSVYKEVSNWASLVAQTVKNLPAMWETWVWFLGWEDPLEEGIVLNSNTR